jgi:hypothetical protein
MAPLTPCYPLSPIAACGELRASYEAEFPYFFSVLWVVNSQDRGDNFGSPI